MFRRKYLTRSLVKYSCDSSRHLSTIHVSVGRKCKNWHGFLLICFLLDFQERFDKCFEGYQVHEVYRPKDTASVKMKEDQKLTSSIFGSFSDAKDYFSIPWIDYNPAEAATLVRHALAQPAGRRELLGILGGGKTSALEELKYYFLFHDERKDILPVSITFN